MVLHKGQILKITDPEGEQVCDLMCFSREDVKEWLSSGRTFDYNNKIYISEGDSLYSNRSRKMLTITEDTVKRHDFLLTPCCKETFEIIYDNHEPHPSCFDNIYSNLKQYGIEPDNIPTTFNIFMNVTMDAQGNISVEPPLSKAGDHISLKAEMDLIVGLTACSAEMSNNYGFKPIDWEVIG